jgi:two-component system LytT family sensor kinase
MLRHDTVTLVHAVGFVTGIALYAMLATMVLRATPPVDRGAPRRAPRLERIPMATAALGLVWNLGALVAYGVPGLGLAGELAWAAEWVRAVAFSALGFLPAVVVHAALQGDRGRAALALTASAYALSGVAAAMHLWGAASGGAALSASALRLLSVSYVVVLGALTVRLRRSPGARGPLAAAALAAFAVMALHLGHHGLERESVPAELIGHHASLALALVILYQDYRFALADLFLKRVLAAVLLIGGALSAYLAVAAFVAARLAADPTDPRGVAVLLALWVATAVAYPTARRIVSGFVDRVVLRRADYTALRGVVAARLATLETPAAVLDATGETLAQALSARDVAWAEADVATLPATPAWADARQQTVTVPVPTAEGPAYALTVGALRAGRRLLSDDLAFVELVGVLAARRIDAVRVARERWEREAREQEIGRLATEAELSALRAQINPHFLFNALTTIGHLLQEAPDRALGTLLRLTGLLRAVLRPPAGSFVPLGEEMEIVEAYLAIEKARFEERLRVTVDVPAELRDLSVPPLLLQPLVENAVKHGISPLRAGGDVTVRARVERGTDGEEARLHLTVADSGAGVAPAELARRRARGVGLANVERRVERQFGAAGAFAFTSAPGAGTAVELWLPVTEQRGEQRGEHAARTGDAGTRRAEPPAALAS